METKPPLDGQLPLLQGKRPKHSHALSGTVRKRVPCRLRLDRIYEELREIWNSGHLPEHRGQGYRLHLPVLPVSQLRALRDIACCFVARDDWQP